MIHRAALRMQKHVADKPSIKPKICCVKTMYFVIHRFVLKIMFDFVCFASLILSSVC